MNGDLELESSFPFTGMAFIEHPEKENCRTDTQERKRLDEWAEALGNDTNVYN